MSYFLGIDAGGSKTYALLADEKGQVLGKGESGNGNHQIHYATAQYNINEAASMALEQAGITREQVDFAYFGLAGADREADFKILHPMIHELGFSKYEIACDTMIGLRAGTTQSFGVSIICGTGTNCAGRNANGDFYQCGGFNYMYGDYGGGGALNVEVFRSVIRAWDGREQETLLTELLLTELNYNSVEEMFNDFLDHDKSVPLHVAKLLFKAAELEDEVACDILHKQGDELGMQAVSVIKRLEMEEATFDVVLAGSLVTRGDQGWIKGRIEQAVKRIAPNASVTKLTVEPVVGAVWSAIEASGGKVDAHIIGNMENMSEFNLI